EWPALWGLPWHRRRRSAGLVRCITLTLWNDVVIEAHAEPAVNPAAATGPTQPWPTPAADRRPAVVAYQTSPERHSQLMDAVGSSGGDDGVERKRKDPSSSGVGRGPS